MGSAEFSETPSLHTFNNYVDADYNVSLEKSLMCFFELFYVLVFGAGHIQEITIFNDESDFV